MSQLNDFPTSPNSRSSWRAASRFKEHLSLALTPIDPQVEQSHFSPDSPTGHHDTDTTQSNRTFSLGSSRSTMYRSPPRSNARDVEKGASSIHTSPRSATTFRDRFTKLFFDVRSLRKERDVDLPIQHPELNEWQPLHIEKRNPRCSCSRCKNDSVRKWRRRMLLIALLLFLFYVFANLIVLNVRVLSSTTTNTHSQIASATPSSSSASSSSTLSADAQQCIMQYTLNAPTSPTTYPCSTCLPLLSNILYNYTSVYPAARDATQFCALRALWEDADSGGQAGLEASGWVQDVRFCAWGGVQCNGSGKVSSLQLTFPAVPASIPAEFGNLTALETLKIIGNNKIPGGSLDQSFSSLTMLSTLHLESTGLNAFPKTLSNLTSLTLIKNAQLPSQLPANVVELPLQILIVNNETLFLTSDQQNAICGNDLGGKLQTCDLRGTGVQSCGSCLVG
ncbi:hypothetical protein EW146_g2349 [Bondarzewia mesenterica]|uniref:Leucine-rich repeat-containing N-terminal plant-type domain-containing protein n=1 Tax=Bondarzewia mesenterica TaxID=1095465 RepID=A0A4S4M0V9_9AGAM|nr:hypothetical protein EW146_g2349 [Bondarzewia mesenterica]